MKQLLEQFTKFGVVGTVAFLLDYVLLMLFTQFWDMKPELAAAFAYILATIFNYLLSMRFVFTRREDISRGGELLAFILLSLVGLGINELIVWFGVALFGSAPFELSAIKIFSAIIGSFWNFFSRKRWLDAD